MSEERVSPDLPPAPATGGSSAAEYRARARGRATGGAASRPDSVRPDSPPVAPAEDDYKRPFTPTEKTLREGVLDIYTGAQMLLGMLDPQTGLAIATHKEKIADQWVLLARKDTSVKRVLQRITSGGAWGGVILAHLPLVLPPLARKGILPGGALFGGAGFNATMPENPDEPDWPYGVPYPEGVVTANGSDGH